MSNTLNYPGDITARFDLDQVIGPDRFGAYYTFKAVEFDPARNQTVAKLRPIPPAERDERFHAKLAKYESQRAAIDFYRGVA